MCGIYGLWSHGRRFPHRAMAETLAHRGPDDLGDWHGAGGALHFGHRRLSILDLSEAGRQPVSTPDGRWTLTYNGEVYNYVELRDELEAAGVRFVSDTDTEVLLHAWARWGEASLDRLYGMFAFAVWDAREEELTLVRDATGIKPLYYAHLSAGGTDGRGAFAFASELGALRHLPGVPFEIDEGAVREVLGAGFVWSGDRTAIQGIRKLPAGHLLRVRSGTASPPVRWWTPPNPTPLSRPLHDALDARADALYDVLRTATDQHLRADVPVGLLLSGGLDSSVLAALAQQCLEARGAGPLRTITMGFEPYAKDERAHARAVAEHVGSDHAEVVIRPQDAAAQLFSHAHHFDDLFGDTGTIQAFAAFGACREAGLTVVLVGEGADELFGGYTQFRDLSSGAVPERLRLYRFFRAYARQRYGPLRRDFAERIRQLNERAAGDWFQTVRLFEIEAQLPASLNLKVDHASMAHSVEARVPYQDRRVAEFALATPRELLLEKGGQGKWVLRHMARRHGLVPESILDRAKMGTPVPWGWLRDGSPFAAGARDTLLAPGSWTRRLGYADLVETFLDGRAWGFPHRHLRRFDKHTNLGWLTMNLLVLDAWARSEMFSAEPEPEPLAA